MFDYIYMYIVYIVCIYIVYVYIYIHSMFDVWCFFPCSGLVVCSGHGRRSSSSDFEVGHMIYLAVKQ